jgi:hypothetical protein
MNATASIVSRVWHFCSTRQPANACCQSILNKAFHGQLVKQAKNEEPATAYSNASVPKERAR